MVQLHLRHSHRRNRCRRLERLRSSCKDGRQHCAGECLINSQLHVGVHQRFAGINVDDTNIEHQLDARLSLPQVCSNESVAQVMRTFRDFWVENAGRVRDGRVSGGLSGERRRHDVTLDEGGALGQASLTSSGDLRRTLGSDKRALLVSLMMRAKLIVYRREAEWARTGCKCENASARFLIPGGHDLSCSPKATAMRPVRGRTIELRSIIDSCTR